MERLDVVLVAWLRRVDKQRFGHEPITHRVSFKFYHIIGYYDKEAFAVFSFKNNNNILHEGIVYAFVQNEKWNIYAIDIAKVDTTVPFTLHSLQGKNTEYIGRGFNITSGYIYDERIKEIRITYVSLLQNNEPLNHKDLEDNKKDFTPNCRI
jgi:hypothetical protein